MATTATTAWSERMKRSFYLHFTKLNALSLSVDAINYLLEIFKSIPDVPSQIEESLKYVIEAYQQQQDVSSGLVDLDVLKRVVGGLIRDVNGSADPMAAARRYFEVVDAFSLKRLKYDAEHKNFVAAREASSLFASPLAKAEYVRARYEVIRQRLNRSAGLFNPTGTSTERLQIASIQSLVATRGPCLIFGMLSQLKEGRYFIEEPEANIELDLAHMRPDDMMHGLYTEQCFVLVEGVHNDGIFRVISMAMPPVESADVTRSIFGHINFWGGQLSETHANLVDIETEAQDAMIVILSDVWLDKPKVLQSLRVLFAGFTAEVAPIAFVFMGGFMSTPFVYNGLDSSRYRECFDALADVIAEFPFLARTSHFIFIPSLNDPGLSTVLPRPGIPQIFTERIRNKVTNTVFTSNPCRIRYCTRELLFFREDMMNKMRRNCIRAPPESENVTELLVHTLFDQAHLCPLPLIVRPVTWTYDHALSLYPLPHALFLGDQYEQFVINYGNSTCCNPGPYSASDFSFLVYYPASNTIEPSKVSVGDEAS